MMSFIIDRLIAHVEKTEKMTNLPNLVFWLIALQSWGKKKSSKNGKDQKTLIN